MIRRNGRMVIENVTKLRWLRRAPRVAFLFLMMQSACAGRGRGTEPVDEPMARGGHTISDDAGAEDSAATGSAPATEERVTLYYLDEAVVRDRTCEATASVTRALPVGTSRLNAVLRSLFEGTTKVERARGILSPFDSTPMDSRAGRLSEYFERAEIAGRVARLHFRKQAMKYLNAAACAQIAVKTSIEKTLRAAFSVDSVEYFIDGQLVTEWDA
jgi:hypothetical protein